MIKYVMCVKNVIANLKLKYVRGILVCCFFFLWKCEIEFGTDQKGKCEVEVGTEGVVDNFIKLW